MSMRRLRQKMRHVAAQCPLTLLQTHSTFRKSVMVSIGVSTLALIDRIFVDAGVKRILRWHISDSKAIACNAWDPCRIHYLPTMRCSCCGLETINLLEWQIGVLLSSHFWHPAEQSEPATKDGEKCSSRSTKCMTSITEAVLDHCLAWFWAKVSSMTQMISGAYVSVWVFVWK